MKEAKGKTDLLHLTELEMRAFIERLGFPAFRGSQLFQWIYRGEKDFSLMQNLPLALRQALGEKAVIGTLTMHRRLVSSKDGSRKYLFRLEDGNTIESVFMSYSFGNSVCLSSQAGCAMSCAFCASTRKGLARSLQSGEIMDQLMKIREEIGEAIQRIVIMGMGEPFENYENLSRFLRVVHEPCGLHMGMRNITVSTCGLVPQIRRFAEDFPQTNLAVSLHAPTDALRDRLMPINRRYPLKDLIPACRAYTEKTRRRISFEYLLIEGINDGKAEAEALCSLLKGMLCHINLIAMNPLTASPFRPTPRAKVEDFCRRLHPFFPVTIRRSLGTDIDAACGQLRLRQMLEGEDQ